VGLQTIRNYDTTLQKIIKNVTEIVFLCVEVGLVFRESNSFSLMRLTTFPASVIVYEFSYINILLTVSIVQKLIPRYKLFSECF
jgi:hypothetical protein